MRSPSRPQTAIDRASYVPHSGHGARRRRESSAKVERAGTSFRSRLNKRSRTLCEKDGYASSSCRRESVHRTESREKLRLQKEREVAKPGKRKKKGPSGELNPGPLPSDCKALRENHATRPHGRSCKGKPNKHYIIFLLDDSIAFTSCKRVPRLVPHALTLHKVLSFC